LPVHTSSVISAQIQTYDLSLYTSLTDKENYCYTTTNALIISPSTPISIYQPKFQALNNAIVAYLNINRTGIVSDLLSICVGYKMMNAMYNSNYSMAINLPANIVFDIDGNNASIQSAAIAAYDDYNGSATPTLTALTSAVTNASANEDILVSSTLIPNMTATVKSMANRLIVEDIPAVGAISKTQVGNWFYGSAIGELGYKSLNNSMNFGLTVPTYVP